MTASWLRARDRGRARGSRLVRRGVTSTSGITAFDISAIAAVDRAAPFGTPPAEIISPDGNVYLHWEFRRDDMACSTLFAHPFILNVQPKPAPLPGAPPLPPFRGPDETPPAPGERHGLRADPPQQVTPRADPALPKFARPSARFSLTGGLVVAKPA